MFPHRSGADVVYLEQAYPWPRFLVSSSFAIATVLMSFNASNAVVFAQYTLIALEIPVTGFNQTVTALTVVLVTTGLVGVSTKWSLRTINFLTVVKIISLAFMVVTGVAVLLGLTRIKDPYANFHNLFEGTTTSPNAFATALVKANYAFHGWQNAYNVLGEVKGPNPVGTVRKSSIIALTLMVALFMLVNVAYVAVVPREEIKSSGQLIAALFFQRLFGPLIGIKVLPLLVASSCFGNIVAVVFRWPSAVLLIIGITSLVILVLPAEDAFNFVLDFLSYPRLIFQSAMCFGVWILRKRRFLAGIPPSILQARNSTVFIYLLSCILLLVVPWVPPEPGHADVSVCAVAYITTFGSFSFRD
ncbi:hypothetical protein C0995_000099 [Termitomyces sp. Mi166|nr:hypothetical protein C0995_000099 [Termitomyces sp. Mi166\